MGQFVEIGDAAYYSDHLHGRKTSTGEIYDKNKLTAAHKTLPAGSEIKVTRLDNGISVRVKVNDCGPHGDGRVVDLSRAAAERIGLIRDGVTRVRVDLVKRGKGDSPCGNIGSAIPTSFNEGTASLTGDLTAKGGSQAAQASRPTLGTGGTYRAELLNPMNPLSQTVLNRRRSVIVILPLYLAPTCMTENTRQFKFF